MTGTVLTRLRLGLTAASALLLAGCGSSGPTGSSRLDFPSSVPGADFALGSSSELGAAGEDFDCRLVETVRVRFGSPGYVDFDEVGLYVFFSGLPEGRKRLRVWWDVENDPVHYRDYVFPDEATEIEEIYEHRYPGLDRPVEKLARVELIRDGLTGNCARNRWVLVAPRGGSVSSSPGPAQQTASVGPPVSAVDGYEFFFYGEGVSFTALTALTIDSVWVDAGASGTLGITLYDATGSTVLDSVSLAVSAGVQRVPLGFSVPSGNYVLTLDGTSIPFPGVGTTSQASYPYEIPGVIRLTDTAFLFAPLYYYLYDWQVTW
jgi:hypothetical protein